MYNQLTNFLWLYWATFLMVPPCCLASTAYGQTAIASVDSDLPQYVPAARIERGSLKSVGSETMSNIMSNWLEDFQAIYPDINAEFDSRGSNNAFPALIAGQANLGQMSREPRKSEIAEFKSRYGYEPTVIPTSIDMLAVYVHRDNPLESLTFAQLDSIFSSTRRRGVRQKATRWGRFTNKVEFENQPITCYGRNAASGTYGYFKESVLSNGDYGAWVNELGGSSLVVQSVGADLGGIGYSGIGFKRPDVKVLSISRTADAAPVPAKPEFALNGQYPLWRFLYLILNRDPREPLNATQAEFLKYVFSRQGQEHVASDGYIPLTSDLSKRILGSLGIER